MDPRERLTAGQAAAQAGRYAEALEDYVWFHDHALEHDPAYYGVRLSFALGYWLELGAAYPPALRKLREIRDAKTQALEGGSTDRDLFHDIASINREMRQTARTCTLFRKLDRQAPAFAARCGTIAFEALLENGAYRLAHRYCADPQSELLERSEEFNHHITRHVGRFDADIVAQIQDAHIGGYCNKAQLIAAMLDGVARPQEARAALEWSVALVDDPEIRARVTSRMVQRQEKSGSE